MLEIVAKERVKDEGFAFSSMLAGIAETVVTPEIRIECPDDLKFELIKKLDAAIGSGGDGFKIRDIIRIDGLRVNFEGGWALVRASNTQPVLVLRFEANDFSTLNKAKVFMKAKLEAVRPGEKVEFLIPDKAAFQSIEEAPLRHAQGGFFYLPSPRSLPAPISVSKLRFLSSLFSAIF